MAGEFFHWTTDFDAYRRLARTTPSMRQYKESEYRIWLQNRLREFKAHGLLPIRMLAEDLWKEEGKPHYNVHPAIVDRLARVNLAKIPSHLIDTPHGLNSTCIRFREAHESLMLKENIPVPKKYTGTKDLKAGDFVHGILMFKVTEAQGRRVLPQVGFVLDFDVWSDQQCQPTYSIFMLPLEQGVMLDKAFDTVLAETDAKTPRGTDWLRIAKNSLRVAVTIGFLSNSNSELIEYDVLSKDRAEYETAKPERRRELEERSRRKGKIGYNIGTDLMFLGARPVQPRAVGESEGRELSWAHIRDGHPHAFRYGKGKELVKIKWLKPTVVRDDLPFKPD